MGFARASVEIYWDAVPARQNFRRGDSYSNVGVGIRFKTGDEGFPPANLDQSTERVRPNVCMLRAA